MVEMQGPSDMFSARPLGYDSIPYLNLRESGACNSRIAPCPYHLSYHLSYLNGLLQAFRA